MTEPNPGPHIAAIQCDGQRIEYHPPNFAMAYAQLAPLVAEAAAFNLAGMDKVAIGKLHEAKRVVDNFSNAMEIANQFGDDYE